MSTRAPAAKLLAADSFRVRVREGVAEVRGFEAHLQRFRRGVEEAKYPRAVAGQRVASEHAAELGEAPQSLFVWKSPLSGEERGRLDAFIEASRSAIAGFGEGFPRLELWREPDGTSRLKCALRPLPELGETLDLRSTLEPPRHSSRTKGPNIDRYAALNRELGAEALLVGADGLVREGATTSLIVWRYEQDTGGCVVDHADRVSSITEALLSSAAETRLVGEKPDRSRGGGALVPSKLSVETLRHSEVWAVNALHGIRPVTHVDGEPRPAPIPDRLRWFREALDRTWEPVRIPGDPEREPPTSPEGVGARVASQPDGVGGLRR